MLRVVEIYRSIQGEGVEIGLPTCFVRLAGCNLRCVWCDTPQAFSGGMEMDEEAIINEVLRYTIPRVCITGGEPLLQDISCLISRLLSSGIAVSVETNGSIPLDELVNSDVTISMDWKCPSSGMSQHMLERNLDLLRGGDQVKFVLSDMSDYLEAKRILERDGGWGTAVFQPVGGLEMRWIAERVLEDGLDVRVLPQLQRIIWGEGDR